MKVILQRDIANLGKRGEIKDVAEGYGMNVLIKKGDAVLATPQQISLWKQKEQQSKLKKDSALAAFEKLTSLLQSQTITIGGKKHDEKGQLFASIKETDIADAIFKTTATSIDPKQITIDGNIKSLGLYTVSIHQGVNKKDFKIEIIK